MRKTPYLLAGLMMLTLAGRGAAQTAHQQVMTYEAFSTYLQMFNAADPKYTDFYHPDVVFHHDVMFGILKGREEIAAFYTNIRRQLDEHVTAKTVVIDKEKQIMAAELSTRLVAKVDGVKMPSGLLNKGDAIISEGTVYYTLRQGRIAEIRGSISGGRKVPAGQVQ